MSTFERAVYRAMALKIEGTPGTDAIAGTPAAADYVDASFTFAPTVEFVPDPSFTGSLDGRHPIAAGEQFIVRGVSIPLRGSGTAGTEPEWFRVLRASSMAVTNTAAALGAPTAATAGTTTSVTLAASPYAATLDVYRGMPITLSGNPATPRTTLITDYSTGRVATLARTFGTALSTSTNTVIPVNQVLRLSDTESDWVRLTCYVYMSGYLTIGVACIALNPSIRLTRGRPGVLTFDLVGKFLSRTADTPIPAGAAAVVRPQVPLWAGGECQLSRAQVFASEAAFGLGTSGFAAPDPEAADGFGLGEIMARAPSASVTLLSNSSASPSRITAMKAGTETLFSAILGSSTANRVGVMFSPAVLGPIEPTTFEGADAERVPLIGTRPGGSMTIASW